MPTAFPSPFKARSRPVQLSLPLRQDEAATAERRERMLIIEPIIAHPERSADVERLVDDALREKKIDPAQRASYLAMCATEAGVETFRGLMAATVPMFQPSGLDGRLPPGSDRPSTAQGIIEAARLLQADRAKAGLTLTMAEAINAVAQRSPA